MNRRTYLFSVGAAALAGCIGGGSSSKTTSPHSSTTSVTPTTTSIETTSEKTLTQTTIGQTTESTTTGRTRKTPTTSKDAEEEISKAQSHLTTAFHSFEQSAGSMNVGLLDVSAATSALKYNWGDVFDDVSLAMTALDRAAQSASPRQQSRIATYRHLGAYIISMTRVESELITAHYYAEGTWSDFFSGDLSSMFQQTQNLSEQLDRAKSHFRTYDSFNPKTLPVISPIPSRDTYRKKWSQFSLELATVSAFETLSKTLHLSTQYLAASADDYSNRDYDRARQDFQQVRQTIENADQTSIDVLAPSFHNFVSGFQCVKNAIYDASKPLANSSLYASNGAGSHADEALSTGQKKLAQCKLALEVPAVKAIRNL